MEACYALYDALRTSSADKVRIMHQQPTACERCGLRSVRRELERNGIIMRFCDECYWDEVGLEPAPEEPASEKTRTPRRTP